MTAPIVFPSATPTIGLPLLIAGQAQKEFFVNQALGILDALHLRSVVASQPAPPAQVNEGDCFRVTAPAAQAWTGREDDIAIRLGGDWHFVTPADGMCLFDRATDHSLFFQTVWQIAPAPAIPATGTVIDVEARTAVTQLIQTLRGIGILAPAPQ